MNILILTQISLISKVNKIVATPKVIISAFASQFLNVRKGCIDKDTLLHDYCCYDTYKEQILAICCLCLKDHAYINIVAFLLIYNVPAESPEE